MLKNKFFTRLLQIFVKVFDKLGCGRGRCYFFTEFNCHFWITESVVLKHGGKYCRSLLVSGGSMTLEVKASKVDI